MAVEQPAWLPAWCVTWVTNVGEQRQDVVFTYSAEHARLVLRGRVISVERVDGWRGQPIPS